MDDKSAYFTHQLALLPEKLRTLALSHEKNHELALLGDSILDLVIKKRLYQSGVSVEKIEEGKQRHASNETLASVAKHHLELEKHIISSSGLNVNPNVSKVLARTMEAIIGAIYLHKEFSEADKFIQAVFY
jgi:dsRNA-specific ribonuclease